VTLLPERRAPARRCAARSRALARGARSRRPSPPSKIPTLSRQNQTGPEPMKNTTHADPRRLPQDFRRPPRARSEEEQVETSAIAILDDGGESLAPRAHGRRDRRPTRRFAVEKGRTAARTAALDPHLAGAHREAARAADDAGPSRRCRAGCRSWLEGVWRSGRCVGNLGRAIARGTSRLPPPASRLLELVNQESTKRRGNHASFYFVSLQYC